MEASQLADNSPLEKLVKAAAIKSKKLKLKKTAKILRSLEEQPEEQASHLQEAETSSKKQCKTIFGAKIQIVETNLAEAQCLKIISR